MLAVAVNGGVVVDAIIILIIERRCIRRGGCLGSDRFE